MTERAPINDSQSQRELDSFVDQLYAIPSTDLGDMFKEYIWTNKHDLNWEGFASRDKTGIRRLFEDVLIYYYTLEPTAKPKGIDKP